MREIFCPAPTRKPLDQQRYGGQWVAIWRRAVIDSDRDLDALCDRLAKRGLEGKAALFGVPPPGVLIV